MLHFEPSRSSTPPRVRLASSHRSNTTLTSTASSTLPLSALTEEHIDVLDDIISRTPHATTFLAVFNAYKEVLQERGINEEDDVIYYGFLLKLGVVKGKDWDTRWNTVKGEVRGSADRSGIRDVWDSSGFPDHSHDLEGEEGIASHIDETPRPFSGGLYKRVSVPARSSRTSTHHVLPSDADNFRTPVVRSPKGKFSTQRSSFPAHLPSPTSDSEASYVDPKRHMWVGSDDATEPDDDNDYHRDSMAPSYQTFATSIPSSSLNPVPKLASIPDPKHPLQVPISKQPPDPLQLKPVLLSKRERGVNGHDFWDVENMERDADGFYEEALTRRYWTVWRSGVEWIFTTSRQVSIAKNVLLLRTYLGKWRTTTIQHQNLEQRVTHVDAVRRLRFAFRKWMRNIEEKRKGEIREGIRRRYSLVKHAVDGRILRQAFKQMLLSSRLAHMERLSDNLAIYGALRAWKDKLRHVQDMSAHVLWFTQERERLSVFLTFHTWKRRVDLIGRDRILKRVMDRRLLDSSWNTWSRTALRSIHAKQFDLRHVLKSSLTVWRNRHNRVKALNKRADTACHRRDLLLLRIIWRLWVVREKGAMFERIQHSQLARAVLQAWQNKLNVVRILDSSAIDFAHSKAAVTHQRAFVSWRDRASRRRAAAATAEMCYYRSLLARAFQSWQKRRKREEHRFRNARLARRWFIKRQCWRRWLVAMDGRALQRKLQYWNLAKTRDYLEVWRNYTVRRRKDEALVEHVQSNQIQRIVAGALGMWKFRTIETHDRELSATQLFGTRLLKATFSKWKDVHSQHQDRVALMRSFRDIKRDELFRKAFIFWYQSTHRSIRRRERLRRKEERTRQALLSEYWGHWYGAFRERRLLGAEDEMVQRVYANTMRTKLKKWKAKTPAMPAIHFEATRTRWKAWKKWRSALPRARLLKLARQTDRRNVLARAFEQLRTVYKAKMNMKAIARARYLRLPSSAHPLQPHVPRARSPFSYVAARASVFPSATDTKTALPKTHMAGSRSSTSISAAAAAIRAPASVPRPPLPLASATLVNRARDVRAWSASPAALRRPLGSAPVRPGNAPALPPVRHTPLAKRRPITNTVNDTNKDEDVASVASSSSSLAIRAPFVSSRRIKIASAPPSTVAHAKETSVSGSLAAGASLAMQARRRQHRVPGTGEGEENDTRASTVASDVARRIVRRPQQPPRPASANGQPVASRTGSFLERGGVKGRPRRGSFLGAV